MSRDPILAPASSETTAGAAIGDEPERAKGAAPVRSAARRDTALWAVLLAASVTTVVYSTSGSAGLAYLGFFALITVPGWPIGAVLFGRRHPAAWVAGAAIGYALSATILAVAIWVGVHTPAALFCLWSAAALAVWLTASGVRQPFVVLPQWTRRSTRALLLTLLIVPALTAPTFPKVGAEDEAGNRYYRAYFTADFVWHVALTAELTRFSFPPANPYLADQPLHYYWTYFVVPAVATHVTGTRDHAVERHLLANAVATGLLFVALIFLTTWAAVPHATAAALAVWLAFLSASAQGLYVLSQYVMNDQPLDGMRNLNIGAITAWTFGGLRIDALPRSLWYTPQHAAACTLGLVAMIVATRGGAASRARASLMAGLALAGSILTSPAIGGVFCLVYGLAIVIDAIRRRHQIVTSVARHSVAAVPVALALVWAAVNQMFTGAGEALEFGFIGLARHSPLTTLALALGPLLAVSLAGLWPIRRLPYTLVPAAIGVLLGLVVLYLVRLRPDPVWLGFRAGQVLQITLPPLAASFIARSVEKKRPARVASFVFVGLALIAGLPTTLIDTYNAQDIANRNMGPGFPWTVRISAAEQEALQWVRRATPREAVVQVEPTSRGRAEWTLIPTFAHRRMAAGLPIGLIAQPEYQERSGQVRRLYETQDPEEALAIADALDIDYLYVSSIDRETFADSLDKFDEHPQWFRPVFRNLEVSIYALDRSRLRQASDATREGHRGTGWDDRN